MKIKQKKGQIILAHQSHHKGMAPYKDYPVIFLTADPSEEAMVEGLNMGAEDFISKPVSIKELEARIVNKIKKLQLQSKESKDRKTIEYPGFKLLIDLQSAEIEGRSIQLPPIEFKLISLFAEHPNEVFSREHISNMHWPNIHVQNQKIDPHLSNLRKKLDPFSENIKTIKSRGYILRI